MNVIFKYCRILGIIFGFVLSSRDSHVLAQCYTEVSQIAWQQYQKADSLYLINAPNAISEYKKAYQTDTLLIEAIYKLGAIYFDKCTVSAYDVLNKSYTDYYSKKARQYFLKVIAQCPQTEDYMSFYCLGNLSYLDKDYTLATYFYNEFLRFSTQHVALRQTAEIRLKECYAIAEWQSAATPSDHFNLEGINTPNNELTPYITPSGHWMLFKRQTHEPDRNSSFSFNQQHYVLAEAVGIDTNQNWLFETKSRLNTLLPEGEFIEHISMDETNEKLYCSLCKTKKTNNQNTTICKIAISDFNQWPNLEFTLLDTNINRLGGNQKHAVVSYDGKTLIFSSDMEGGMGGFDLYESRKDSLGNWQPAQNMGSAINTLNDEIYPNLHFDSQTLFFSSNGWFGQGGFDLFSAKLIDGIWQEVENLGPIINSEKDEKEVTLDALGLNAIATTNEFGMVGLTDIIGFRIPFELKPAPSVIINGRIVDDKNQALKGTSLNLIPIKQQQQAEGQIIIRDDYFSMILPKLGNQYLITVSKLGYTFSNQFVDFSQNQNAAFLNIRMQPQKKGISFVLNGVFFPKNSALLDKKSEPMLNSLIDYLNEYPTLTFEIATKFKDADIQTQAEAELLNNRSQAIFQYLRFNGINPSRMNVTDVEVGENESKTPTQTDEFEVVIKIVEK